MNKFSSTTFSAWDEIIDVFGDGHDYDWALAADDDQEIADEAEKKLDMKYRDVSQNAF